ncbi:MAG: translation initiation factor IF-2 [Christensenellaceae bacterium]|jgi:translation initiation factor IF-2|nr:translation initiation factor IF-2 [Christensenellaceae bacterium]
MLDSIKGIKDLLPKVGDMRAKVSALFGEYQIKVKEANQKVILAEQKRAEEAERVVKQEKFKDLIEQRAQEKARAEEKFSSKEKAREQAEKPAQQTEARTPAPAAPTSERSYTQTPYNRTPNNGNFAPRPQNPNYQGNRPAYQGGYQGNRPQNPNGYQGNRPFNGGGYQGNRPQNPNGVRGVFVPRAGQGTAQQQQQQFGPRQFGGGYGGPRPAGAGYQGARPFNGGGFQNRPQTGGTGFGLPRPTERLAVKTNTFDTNKRKKSGGGNYEENRRGYSMRDLMRKGMIEEQEIEGRNSTRLYRNKKARENSKTEIQPKSTIIAITTHNLTVKELSEKIGESAAKIIKQLMVLGNMSNINSFIDFETAELVAAEFGYTLELKADKTFEERISDKKSKAIGGDSENAKPRPPIVTVLGHVDHGKTSLLDTIRNTKVVSGEAGGITQHIGAYQVEVRKRKITFIDTPGHAAFDKMRERGAKLTDIAILIVAGDDGIMPQTIEAINHIQKQHLPMIVAVNKCDKPEFDIDRVKNQLTEYNVVPEDWGGDAIIVPISATENIGIDKLLDMVLLVADMNDYKADYDADAFGVVLEARLDKAKGPVATILVKNGTLKVGDTALSGLTYGKVRAMFDSAGKAVRVATPAMPVQIVGYAEVPTAGDDVYVVDEKLSKQVIDERKTKAKSSATVGAKILDADAALSKMTQSDKKPLNIILKTDVAGSVEAIKQSLANITSDEVSVNVISAGVGNITDSDVDLASVSGALLIAFNTKTTPTAKTYAEKLKVKVYNYSIIYQIFDFITEQMVRLFTPKWQVKYFGKAEVRALFKSSALGQIAGCMVVDGKIYRGETATIYRDGVSLGEYTLSSLKIGKDDAKSVDKGYECGIKIDGAPEFKVGDVVEVNGKEQLPIIWNGKKYEF